ncbi:hypothetical protein M405DRAFT_812785 [Rhizopogon salebrosus TDB-379]|nr:hypothetical protein M405DRAFT_812785 [Rhizopogon salebrosus TDB-379]
MKAWSKGRGAAHITTVTPRLISDVRCDFKNSDKSIIVTEFTIVKLPPFHHHCSFEIEISTTLSHRSPLKFEQFNPFARMNIHECHSIGFKLISKRREPLRITGQGPAQGSSTRSMRRSLRICITNQLLERLLKVAIRFSGNLDEASAMFTLRS